MKLHMRKEDVDQMFSWMQRLSVVSLLLMVIYLALVERPPLRYSNVPFPVINRITYPGDTLLMTVSTHSDSAEDASYTSSLWLVNVDSGDKFPLKPAVASVRPGDYTAIKSNIVIPKDILELSAAGVYYVAGVAEVSGSFARNFKVSWRTQDFRIIRPGEKVAP